MRRQALVFLSLVALLGIGCRRPPPPPAPPPPVQTRPPPPPPSPPPPPRAPAKCETLEEKCLAAADTRMSFGAQGASFAPPASWTCAFEKTQAITVAPDGNGVIAFTDAAGKKPAELWATLSRLLERLAVSGVEKKALEWHRPGTKWQAGSLPVKVWQIEKPSHGWSLQQRDPVMNGAPGVVLVTVIEASDKVEMGVGYLPRSAPATLFDTVKTSMQSVQLAP